MWPSRAAGAREHTRRPWPRPPPTAPSSTAGSRLPCTATLPSRRRDPTPRRAGCASRRRSPSPPASRISAEQLAGPHAEVDHRHVEVGQRHRTARACAAARCARSRRRRARRPTSRTPAAPARRPRPGRGGAAARSTTSASIRASHVAGSPEHQRLRPLVVPRRAALDQVARQRERRAGEPDQRHVELLAQQRGSPRAHAARPASGSSGRSRATSVGVRIGLVDDRAARRARSAPATPTAASGTMMSLNTIAASSAIRRSGCSVISTTCSGCRQVSRMSRSPRSSRYSGR